MKSTRNKSIGYLAPQYHKAKAYTDYENIEAINNVLKVYTIKAQSVSEPDWYVKNADLYFTYEEEHYVINSYSINTTSEIFDCVSKEMIDSLYEAGAYDMFYA